MTEKLLSDILESVQSTSTDVKELDKKFELHKQKMEYEIEKINQLDAKQNTLIDEHIEGVDTLKQMHVAHREETHKMIKELTDYCEKQNKATDRRLERLEAPSNWMVWLKTNKKIVMAVVAAAGGGLTLLRFWEYVQKFLMGS